MTRKTIRDRVSNLQLSEPQMITKRTSWGSLQPTNEQSGEVPQQGGQPVSEQSQESGTETTQATKRLGVRLRPSLRKSVPVKKTKLLLKKPTKLLLKKPTKLLLKKPTKLLLKKPTKLLLRKSTKRLKKHAYKKSLT